MCLVFLLITKSWAYFLFNKNLDWKFSFYKESLQIENRQKYSESQRKLWFHRIFSFSYYRNTNFSVNFAHKQINFYCWVFFLITKSTAYFLLSKNVVWKFSLYKENLLAEKRLKYPKSKRNLWFHLIFSFSCNRNTNFCLNLAYKQIH